MTRPKIESSILREPTAVSMLVLVYNQEKYLRGFLGNLPRIQAPTLQIILSDNCSTDRSVALIQEYLGSPGDDRARFFQQSKNIGVVNHGKFLWQEADTPLAFYAHPDDLHGAEFVTSCLRPFEKDAETILSMCQPKFMDEQGRPHTREPKDSVLLDPRMMSRAELLQYFMHGTTGLFIYGIFNKEKIGRLRIPLAELSHHPFWEFPLLLACFLNGPVAVVPEREFTYRLHIHAAPGAPHVDTHDGDTGTRTPPSGPLPVHAARLMVRLWEIVDLHSPRGRWGKRMDKFWLLLGAWRSEGGSMNWYWRVKETLGRDLWIFARTGHWKEFFVLLSFVPLKIRPLRLLIRQRKI